MIATCKNCFHYDVCSLWSTTDLEEDEAHKHCYGHFKPNTDVREVKHGYWKWEKKVEPQAQNRLYCSVCDKECLGKNNYYVTSNWCPHCGARMDAESQED